MTDNEFQVILQEGEGYRLEFKESLSNLDREMVAFANGSGGKLFLGITDDRVVKGVAIDNKLKAQIQDIANNCQPAVKILFEEYQNILIVHVREGDDKPYKCSTGFYLRVGPNSQKLNRDEIIEFFKAEGKIRYDELVCTRFNFDEHFDAEKLGKFLRLAGITNLLDSPAMLANLGVAEKQEGKVIVNNTGAMFFAKNLNDIYFHTAVTCALYKGTEKVEVLDRRDFNEDLISNIDRAMIFLQHHLPVRYEMTGTPRRKEIPEVPYGALREAVINAVAHRDYFEKGANVMVEIFDDRIEITNPGGLVKGLRPEDFGTKSVLRNPNIASLLHRVDYIEKMGTGINKIRLLIKEAKLLPPQFEFGTFFTVIFKRPIADETKAISENFSVNFGANFGLKGKKLERVVKLLQMFYDGQIITATQAAVKFRTTRRTIENDIDFLRKHGLIDFIGSLKTGKYILTKDGKKSIKKLMK